MGLNLDAISQVELGWCPQCRRQPIGENGPSPHPPARTTETRLLWDSLGFGLDLDELGQSIY